MNLIGWDIAVDNHGVLTMIEFNMCPDCELIQIFNGPMSGDMTDELMEMVKNATSQEVTAFRTTFPSFPASHHHLYDIRRQHWF